MSKEREPVTTRRGLSPEELTAREKPVMVNGCLRGAVLSLVCSTLIAVLLHDRAGTVLLPVAICALAFSVLLDWAEQRGILDTGEEEE